MENVFGATSLETEDKYKEIINNLEILKEKTGENNAKTVNDLEKTEWELNYDKIREQLVKEKINKNKPVALNELSWGRVIQQGINNIPSDFVQFAPEEIKNIYGSVKQIFSHPIITSKGMAKVAKGLAEKAIFEYHISLAKEHNLIDKLPEYIKNYKKYADENMVMASQFLEEEFYKKYGTENNFKKSVAEKPFHTLFDLSIPLVLTSKIFKAFELPSQMSKIAKGMEYAKYIDPLNMAIGPPVKLAGKLAQSLHTKALGLTGTIPVERAIKLERISLNNGLGAKLKSVDKLQSQITDIRKVINEAVASVDNEIPVQAIFKNLDEYEKVMRATSSTGNQVSKTINTFKKSITDANRELGRSTLTAAERQAYKVKFNKELHKFYQNLEKSTIGMHLKEEITSVVNKTIREDLETIIPDLKLSKFKRVTKNIIKKEYPEIKEISLRDLNNLNGALIELRETVNNLSKEMRVADYFNYKTASLIYRGGVIGGGIGGSMSGIEGVGIGSGIGMSTGLLLGIMDGSPKLRMSIGNVLNKMKKIGISTTTSNNATLIRWGLYKGGELLSNPEIKRENIEGLRMYNYK